MTKPAPFIFTRNPKFTAEVVVHWPNADGSFEAMSFTGHFVLSEDVDLTQPIEAETPEDRVSQEIDRLLQIFEGWDGIGTPDGNDLGVSEEAMDALLAQVPIRMGIVAAYMQAVYQGGLRLGNSVPSPATSGGARKKKPKTVRH